VTLATDEISKLAPTAKYIVRHGSMRLMGEFEASGFPPLARLQPIIIKTERGLEHGEVLCPSTSKAVNYLAEPTSGQIVRTMTAEDQARAVQVRDLQKKEYDVGRAIVAEHKLAMQVIDVEHLFGGERIEQPAGTLSGGEKTRLALATLVVSSANVLLLDEPTNNLDPASRAEVLKALRTYEGAIVLVTHDPGAVDALSPDRVILMPDGVEDTWSDDLEDLVALA